MVSIDLPYISNSAIYFEKIRTFDWPIFLDSCYQESLELNPLSRYDIITAAPIIKILDNNGSVNVIKNGEVKQKNNHPLNVLDEEMAPFKANKSNLPFVGGALGYLSYELNDISSKKNLIPKFMIGIYDWAIVVDHHKKITSLVSCCHDSSTKDLIDQLTHIYSDLSPVKDLTEFHILNPLLSDTSFEDYKHQFQKVQEYLKAGDCYQVNLSIKYEANTSGDIWQFYKKFREINQSPFMSFMKFDQFEILSGSPEQFIHSDGYDVTTRPIKGTQSRGMNAKDDENKKNMLIISKKDQAENLMIVDLLRNDLGKNCETGSVEAKQLFEVEKYPNVFHLVSTIKGKLKKNSNNYQLLKDAYPGGSVTGAPKKRSMEIIDELENHSRDFYCGSNILFSFDSSLNSNIAIRSMIHKDHKLSVYSGGGLTISSNLEDEYNEISDKLGNIKRTINFFERKS